MLNQLLLQHGLLSLHHMNNVEKIFLHIHPVALPILNTKEEISVLKHKLSIWLKMKMYFSKILNRDKHKTINYVMSKYQNIPLLCGITHKMNFINSKYITFYSNVEKILRFHFLSVTEILWNLNRSYAEVIYHDVYIL